MVFGLKFGGLPRKVAAEPPPRNDPAPAKNAGSSGTTRALTVNEFVARTKRCREQGLKPTKPELVAYARYLGIDSITDGDLMWIAEESLSAPLPAEWTEHHDNHNRVFYYNVQTHASSWTHPLEQLHRDTYKNIVNFRSGDLTRDEQGAELEKLRRLCEEAERAAHRELQAWTEHVDDQGQKFYYNHEHKRSVWTDPRPAHCHELYLQMKALRVLSRHCGQGAHSARGPEPLNADSKASADRDTLRVNRLKHHALSAAVNNEPDPSGDEGGGKEGKRKRKKRKNDEPEIEEVDHMQDQFDQDDFGRGRGQMMRDDHRDLSPLQGRHHEGLDPLLGGRPGLGGPGEFKNHLLDLKKPSTAAVNEVRQAIGVSESTGMSPRKLPGLGAGTLPAFEGDGLNPIGRTRVRAGIKLAPLSNP